MPGRPLRSRGRFADGSPLPLGSVPAPLHQALLGYARDVLVMLGARDLPWQESLCALRAASKLLEHFPTLPQPVTPGDVGELLQILLDSELILAAHNGGVQ